MQLVPCHPSNNKEDKWSAGVVVNESGDLMYLVKLSNGSHCREKQKQLIICNVYLTNNDTSIIIHLTTLVHLIRCGGILDMNIYKYIMYF